MPPTPRALVTVLISTAGMVNCAGDPGIGPSEEPVTSGAPLPPTEAAAFHDRAAEVGLAFRHRNGGRGRYLLPEIMGSGAALFDADGDGDLDAYLVQGGDLEPGAGAAGSPARDRLFRNELIETGELRFVDATDGSGIEEGATAWASPPETSTETAASTST